MNNKKMNTVFIYLAGLLLFLTVITTVMGRDTKVSDYTYTEIVGYFQRGEVNTYTVDMEKQTLSITKLNDKVSDINYKLPNVGLFFEDTREYVWAYNQAHPEAPMEGTVIPPKQATFLSMAIPYILMFVVLMVLMSFLMKGMGGGGLSSSFGKARVKTASEGRRVTFDDVAGAKEEKEELVEVVDFLRNPNKFNTLGARIPKGVMLIGPPGTGKTLLARAVAGEADVQFFSIAGSDFVEMFVGVGAGRVRDLFEQAKKSAPSVIFIDEIDAVGRQRGAGLGGGHDEREQTLNQLLVEMDGFSSNTGVIVIAATNRSDVLDPALLRSGRFDRRIMVGYPDVIGREEILKVHSKNKPLGPDVSLATVAKSTIGFTGADLENLMNESALLAAKHERKAITMEDIAESTMKVLLGPEKRSKLVTPEENRLTAYHEAGHAVVSYHLPTQDAVHQVSIVGRGSAGGYTLNLPDKDVSYKTKREMEEDITTFMGGRVAEELILKDVSTGASSDLERATKIARDMVTRYGFSSKIGPVVYGSDKNEVFLGRDYFNSSDVSQEVAANIDQEIHAIMTTAYTRATDLLIENNAQLEMVAQFLLRHEKIEAEEFEELMKTNAVKGKYPLEPQSVFETPTTTPEAPANPLGL